MDPQNQPKPSTEQIDQLLAFVSAHKEQVNDILNNAAGGIITVVVISVIVFLARQFHSQFQQFIGHLGSFRGLSKLAWWAYRRNVIDQYGKLINIYLGITETLSLNQVFVPLTLRATRRTATPNPTQPPSTQAILTDPEQKRLLLLGAPGSGKSTLLRALAVGISRHEWPQFNNLIPVLVSLRDYAQKEPAQPLFTWLTEHELPRFGIAKPHSLLAAMLAKGRVLLLLDGLDEVAGERLDSINRAIAQFLTDYDPKAQCRVLLTCREQNYDELPDSQYYTRLGFKEYRVAELRDAEIRAIVHRRQTSFTDKQKSLPNYLAQVFRDSSILQLHRNPLLLTLSMGVFLHKPGEEIPHNLAQFYEQALDNLLRRHDFREAHSGQPANRYKAECKFKVLRYFAHQNLMAASTANRDFETFSFQDIKAAAQALAEQGRVDYKPDAAHEVVKEIQMQAGLLNALQDGSCYLYAHRSLNEYCAAAYLNRQNAAGFDLLSQHLTDTAWRQVIIFYAAIDDDNDNAVHLVTQLQTLAHNAHNPQLLALAGHCAAVLVQPRPELRLSLLADLATTLQIETAITMRETLLKSLLALGNSRDTTLRQRLDVLMRQLLEAGHIDELISEISRLETAVALQFLSYLASSPELSRKLTALRGLSQFDSLDTIPLLWQLLGDFRALGEAASANATLSRLLVLLAEDGAVERLNECAAPVIDVATRQQVYEVYPFLPVAQPATAFAVLLLWAKQAGVAGAAVATDAAWQQFLGVVLGDKSAADLKAWLKLPRDKDKWTGRVRMLTVGRLLFGGPVVCGVGLMGLMLILKTDGDSSANSLQNIFFLFLLLSFVGLLMPLVFVLWRFALKRWGRLGELDAFPALVRHYFLSAVAPVGMGKFKKMANFVGRNFNRTLLFTGLGFCLAFFAGFLHNPAFNGHEGLINSLASTSATSSVVTGSDDNTARLWDSQTGRELRRFQHDDDVRAVALSADGLRVMTGSDDNTARLWDSQTGRELRRFQHDDYVRAVALSPDGLRVLTGSSDNTARLWDSQTGRELRRFQHNSDVNAVAFAPDGLRVLTGSWDKTARLWDSQTGRELRRFQHDAGVSKVAFAPDGLRVLTGSSDNTARLWDSQTGRELRRFQHDGYVNAVAFAPDGLWVLTGSWDNTARLWDSKTGAVLRLITLINTVYNTVYAVAYTPDGSGIYTASSDGILRLWDSQTGQLRWATSKPFWDKDTWTIDILYIWLALVFLSLFIPCLKCFDPGRVWFIRKPNRYIQFYQIPGINRWLPPQD